MFLTVISLIAIVICSLTMYTVMYNDYMKGDALDNYRGLVIYIASLVLLIVCVNNIINNWVVTGLISFALSVINFLFFNFNRSE